MKIIVGFDGSDDANSAVDLAGSLAAAADGSVLLVTAVPDVRALRRTWGALLIGSTGELERELDAEAEAALAKPLARLRSSGVQAEAVVGRGRAPQVIADRASRAAADLVVLGSRGLGPMRAAVLGSVSQEVLDRARWPVLIARGPRIERAVLGADGSPGAAAAEQLLRSLPIADRIPVEVMSVAELLRPLAIGIAPTLYTHALARQAEYEADARQHHLAIAEAAAERLKAVGIAATASVRVGDAAAELVAAANAETDLIVVGTRGRTGIRRLVLGSVARRVLHHARASVLVAKPGAGG